jgi:tripartite-type tricarboxylate transporter receptor subunit TctC
MRMTLLKQGTSPKESTVRVHHALSTICFAALIDAVPTSALAQKPPADNYPSRPVSVVIPYSAGGSTDGEARLYTEKLQASLGQPFVFDFKVGAGSSIGVAYAAKATPDGYTLLVTPVGMTVLPNFYPEVNETVIKSLITISELSSRATAILVSPAALPNVHTIKDLIAHAKANSGKPLFCGTTGAGGIGHTVCGSIAVGTGIPLAFVHYKGVTQSQADLIGGRTQLSAGTLFAAMGQIRAGKLRAIAAIGGEQRSTLMPDLPTAVEQGVDVKYPSWLGAFAPAGTPQPIINKLNAELVKAVRSPDVMQILAKQGNVPVGSSPAEFRKKVDSEIDYWKRIVAEAKIRMDAK